MVFNEARGEAIVYGGSLGGAAFAKIWAWNGRDWGRQADGPVAGWATLAYDTDRRQVFAHILNNQWSDAPAQVFTSWDGSAWRLPRPDPAPATVRMPSLVFDGSAHEVLVFGGQFLEPMRSSNLWA